MATINKVSNSSVFRDLDLNLNIHPIRKDINLVLDEMAVITSIKNLVMTNHFERPFRPHVGSNLRRLLFEMMDQITSSQIEREITETITNFEPRVSISQVVSTPDVDNNGYNISIQFLVINNPDQITINFFLERIR